MPRVSVVIPLFNAERFIRETLDSVFCQTYRDFEVIVVDDGSTDRSPTMVQTYGRDIRYVRQENLDVAAARNTGIRVSQGEFIAFLDQDDVWAPQKLERQVSVFEEMPDSHVVFCDMVRWYGGENTRHEKWRHRYNRRAVRGDMAKALLLRCSFQPSTVMVARACFEKGGYFDESLRVSSDWDMWLRLACLNYRFRYIEEVLCFYRDHGGNTFRSSEKMEKDRFRVLKKATERMPLSSSLKKKAYAKAHSESGLQFYHEGSYGRAYRHFREAFALDPISLTFKGYKRLVQSYVKQRA